MPYYKIENNKAQVGNKPHGAEWIEFTVGNEPQELIDGLEPTDVELLEQELAIKKQYLADTDYKVLPDYDGDTTGVLEARAEARTFIRNNNG